MLIPVTPARNNASFTAPSRSVRMMQLMSFIGFPGSGVVVQKELVRMRPQIYGRQILAPLHVHPCLDHVWREYISLEQESVVLLQRGQHFAERARSVLDAEAGRTLELVQVLVDRCRRLDLLPDPIESRHQQRRKREIGIARWIWRAELDALRLRARRVHRDATDRRPVAL